jgi:tetratricopeptide (TPR) repeat protein
VRWPASKLMTRPTLRDICPDDDTAARLQALLAGTAGTSAQEIGYAFRRLVEHIGASQPLVLIFEDIHWADPALLDLIEYVATWTRGAPIVIVCPSRPELLDTRPAWGSGRMEANRISLEPLTEEESRSLLGALLTVEDLPSELRQRVLDRAEGNPLFVEEVVRMLIEEGVVVRRDGHWFATKEAANVRVPDSVEALIRARLDTLPAPERVLLQAGSVVGRVFQRSAVAAIAPPDQVPPPLETHLEDAILRDIITDERSVDEPTFRFRHILIRDVAYNTLPKARRADLHLAVAGWLREWAGARIDEFVEIEAYHLEQAVKLRGEVGAPIDGSERDAAAEALRASAQKAAVRRDSRAARSFAERGLALDPTSTNTRLDLTWLVVDALGNLGEFSAVTELAKQLEPAAVAAGRRDIEGRTMWAKAIAGWITPESANAQQALASIRRARDLLTEVGDWNYVVLAIEFLGYEGWWYGDMDKAEDEWVEAVKVAREHGLIDAEVQGVLHLGQVAAMRGQPEVRRARLREALELVEHGGSRLMRARIARQLGTFTSNNDSEDEGRRLMTEAAATLDELGDSEELCSALQFIGDSWHREGNLAAAIEYYRLAIPHVAEHVGYLPEAQRRLATALLEMGDIKGAEQLAEEARRVTINDDWSTVASTATVLGTVRAAQGRLEEAEELLRLGVDVLEGKDFGEFDEYLALGEFLCRTGRAAEGRQWLDRLRTLVATMSPTAPLRMFYERRAAAAEALATEG